MSVFFRLFQHLLPRSFAWRMIVDKFLRKWFTGLVSFQERYKLFTDQIYEDLDPQLTRELPAWEKQFQLPGSGIETERRQALNAAWKAQGGQSPGYLQDLLQDAGFDLYVHEAWYYDGPVKRIRNPNLYIGDETYITVCGEPEAVCGEPEAVCGEKIEGGYLLVNKGPGISYFKPSAFSCCGEPEAVCGEPEAICGEVTGIRFIPKEYQIPPGSGYWPFFVYVGAEYFPDLADIPSSRRIELERMILKYFPDQLWIGMMINYV